MTSLIPTAHQGHEAGTRPVDPTRPLEPGGPSALGSDALVGCLPDVIAIAEEAGRHVASYFRKEFAVHTKGRSSLVSEVDLSTEVMLRAALARTFPGEAVLGEEGGLDRDPDGAWWAVDPLDGTTNFVCGLPLFCVALARIEAGRATLAVIHDPIACETFAAVRGRGAWLDGRPIRVVEPNAGQRPVLSLRHGLVRQYPAVLPRMGTDKIRCLGSACLDLAYVAAGRFHGVAVRKVKLWDVAAGALLVEEAGGTTLSFDARPFYPLTLPARAFVDRRAPIIGGSTGIATRLAAILT